VLIGYQVHVSKLQELHIRSLFNTCLLINICITLHILQNISRLYLRKLSALDVAVFGNIDVILTKELAAESRQIPAETLLTHFCAAST
jgi:hypothetical protein